MSICRVHRALLLTAWFLLTGFAHDEALQRLAPEKASAATKKNQPECDGALRNGYVDHEARTSLPRCTTQTLRAKLDDGCTLSMAYANADTAAALRFVVSLPDKAGKFTPKLVTELGPKSGWVDAALPITKELTTTRVRFSIEGEHPAEGIITQPRVVCAAHAAKARPKNLILLSLDTLRADRLGTYGQTRELMPFLDRMASEGSVFLQAYAHYPNTLGSHAALFTSDYPSRVGMVGGPNAQLRADQATLATELAARGYVTTAFTEDAFVGSAFGFNRGFDRYDDGGNSLEHLRGQADQTFANGLEWLKHRPDAPFFLFLHTYEVHSPYDPPPDAMAQLRSWQPDYKGNLSSSFPENQLTPLGRIKLSPEDLRWFEGLYDAKVWSFDRKLAALFDELKKLGVLDSTLVVFISDHGEEFAEHGPLGHGETLHEQVLHVPLIFWQPGNVPAGLQVNQVVSLIDVAPTIADLLDLGPILSGTPGHSLAPRLRGKLTNPNTSSIGELAASANACKHKAKLFEDCPYQGVTIRDRQYSYIHSAASGEEHLYDRRTDPNETVDLASSKPDITQAYRAQAERFRNTKPKREKAERKQAIDSTTENKLRALGYVK